MVIGGNPVVRTVPYFEKLCFDSDCDQQNTDEKNDNVKQECCKELEIQRPRLSRFTYRYVLVDLQIFEYQSPSMGNEGINASFFQFAGDPDTDYKVEDDEKKGNYPDSKDYIVIDHGYLAQRISIKIP